MKQTQRTERAKTCQNDSLELEQKILSNVKNGIMQENIEQSKQMDLINLFLEGEKKKRVRLISNPLFQEGQMECDLVSPYSRSYRRTKAHNGARTAEQ